MLTKGNKNRTLKTLKKIENRPTATGPGGTSPLRPLSPDTRVATEEAHHPVQDADGGEEQGQTTQTPMKLNAMCA